MKGRVLDVACGVGTNVRYPPDGSEYIGIDISAEMLANVEKRLNLRAHETTLYEMDAHDLEFPNDSFETVISSLSLYLPRPRRGILGNGTSLYSERTDSALGTRP